MKLLRLLFISLILFVSLNIKAQTYFSATGGEVTIVGNYKVHKFTSNGTFVISSSVPSGSWNVEILVIGGGAGGASGGGGGGAGQLVYISSYAVTATSYTVTIGTGGSGGTSNGNGSNGNNTTFSTITATGGGGGGGQYNNGLSGASGGGVEQVVWGQ